ncbi:hypothetical protein DHW03_17335 [Pedobacter yonginense]|uniref:Uncharacterized protein n=1 Tax=Pedobacter yonginense TaxID=651869 RepID=A0A317EMM7_9SPHI|nr:hypothetical protein [Pedobacter yonginense]PWS26536.1 hypothetical protein DHW03_17335 [Pedobacter yonginense]
MMNQQDIFKKIGNILTELNDQYQFLAQNPGQLNDLEVELFLANANFLSDHVQIVKKLNTINQKDKPQSQPVANFERVENVQHTAVDDFAQQIDEGLNDLEELADVATAEEEEERVDVKQEQEIFDEQEIHEATAERILEQDFFKPDQSDKTFEFVLGNHNENDQFDYEAKPVEEIFDRPLSKAEEEILAQKKRIHEKEELQADAVEETENITEDEIGPEPFLISHEVGEGQHKEPELEFPTADEITEPIEALKDVDFDDPVISPPVVEERPVFTPEAVPVKSIVEPVSTKTAPSLNDLLGKTNSHSEPSKPQIADLKQAINLNEKLLFIKDLFNGYNLAYSEAIDLVNKMNSFEMADSFLQKNYAVKNNWASKQATVDQFYELLNRRFSK